MPRAVSDVCTAYGEHKCDLCPNPILPGQQYLRTTEPSLNQGQPTGRYRVSRQHHPLCSEHTRGQ